MNPRLAWDLAHLPPLLRSIVPGVIALGRRVVVTGAAAALVCSLCPDAHALGPVDVEVGVIAGAGTTPTSGGNAAVVGGTGAGAPNMLGFGLGGRGGVGLGALYLGVEGMYYFGGSTGDPSANVSVGSDLFGVDVGYSLKLPVVTIRPLLGVGNFTERASGLPLPALPVGVTGGGSSSSQSSSTLYVQPGLTALFPLGSLYVGGDVNALWLHSLPETVNGSGTGSYLALTVHAQIGARF